MNIQKHKATWLLAFSLLWSAAWSRGVTLPAGTPVTVALKADLSSENTQEGQRVEFEVAVPVLVNGVVIIPKGSLAWGGIQESKAGGGKLRGRSKEVKFDVEAVRLPDLRVIKLRTTREHKDFDVIKVTSEFGPGVGAPQGTTYTVYLDADFDTAASPAPAASLPAPKPTVSPARPVAPPAAVAATVQPAPPPQAAPPAGVQPAPPVRTSGVTFGPSTEWITVECFSTPAGAEILIDGDYYGNTQSIIKVPAGNHKLQLKLEGYKPYDVPLDIPVSSPVRTIRKDLESLEQ